MSDSSLDLTIAAYKTQRAQELAYLTDKTQEAGLIPASAIKPADGVVESSASVDLMVRVAKALVRPMVVQDAMAPGGKRDATPYEKLATAGCPVEVYDQLVGHPEFKTIYMKVIEASVFLPSLPDAARSVRTKAVNGDKDAWLSMIKAMRLDDSPDDDSLRQQYRSMDQATFERVMDEELEKANAIYKRISNVPSHSRRDAALLEEGELEAPPVEESIDHAKIHNDSSD